jgi:DNA-binding transcriptional LysR family regulator
LSPHAVATIRLLEKQVTWQELYAHEYVSVDKTSGNRLLLDQALANAALAVQSICETRHATTMLGLIEAGLGVAVVPSMAMPLRDHPVLTSVPLVDPVVMRRVGIVRRRGASARAGRAAVLSDDSRHEAQRSIPSMWRWCPSTR